ncbi:MAG: Gfo/Idh/MocA family oxidoreductase [Thermoguttaceae bacterium]|nr:Gfo/Idh/MocA family oxidoreductase [Thermoguttaceae bacterium]MDW8077270.1 Gfo/Idh/MocA family oxidoreductase [Thermoguttaceae bacterium]
MLHSHDVGQHSVGAINRRQFAAWTTAIASTATAQKALPAVHVAEDNTIRLALIGCGGRGCGAVSDACEVPGGPVELVAMADIFADRLENALKQLTQRYPKQMNVPPERRFIGFDAYRQAIDCVSPGGVAILAGYAAFRPAQLEYAVEKNVHVFMEKSFASDPPGCRRVLAASEAAEQKNLKIAAGLMARHSRNRQELICRIREGELGEIVEIRAYRMHPSGPLPPKAPNVSELIWQIRNFVHFLWVSGGLWAEMDIHQVDEICWVLDSYPIRAIGIGGRTNPAMDFGQNYDQVHVEWTFSDGICASHTARWLPNCDTDFGTYIVGTKRAALMPWLWGQRDATIIYKDRRGDPENVAWKGEKEQFTHWQWEWVDLLEAIRKDLPYNEGKRAALVNLATIMGRAALHSGKTINWEQVYNSKFQFCSYVDEMTLDSAAPVEPLPDGRYPLPVPGFWSEV